MSFLLQLYAPISEYEYTFHRQLYVFCCLKSKCQRSGKEIKVIRQQLPRKNEYYSYEPPNKEQIELCTKRRNLQLPLFIKEQTIELFKEKKKITQKIKQFIDTDEEDDELLKSYLNSQIEPQLTNNMDDEESKDTKEIQIPERSVENTFLLFNYVVQSNPPHLIRYCRDTTIAPLWMSKCHSPVPLKCQSCGGTMIAELQLMPKLFMEITQLLELDFETIIVFTCKDSCNVKGYSEERVVISYCDIKESIHTIKPTKLLPDSTVAIK